MRIDLHLHSTASDGMHTPAEVVHLAKEAGVIALALTDHDSISGLREAAQAAQMVSLPMLHGIEMSVGGDREIHLLGYGVPLEDEAIQAFYAEQKLERVQRIEKMVALLQQQGFEITMDEVRALSQGLLSRSHVARVLVEHGIVPHVKAAFEKYLNPGKLAYVPRREVGVGEACALLKRCGAVPVLAHPGQLKMGQMALDSLLEAWQAQGLAGVEVYHPSHQANHTAHLERFAREHGLLVTGGSDFHGEQMRPTPIAQGVERWKNAMRDTQALFERIGPQGRTGAL